MLNLHVQNATFHITVIQDEVLSGMKMHKLESNLPFAFATLETTIILYFGLELIDRIWYFVGQH